MEHGPLKFRRNRSYFPRNRDAQTGANIAHGFNRGVRGKDIFVMVLTIYLSSLLGDGLRVRGKARVSVIIFCAEHQHSLAPFIFRNMNHFS